MRYLNRLDAVLLLLLFSLSGWAVSRNYGLYFQSYSVPSDQRTVLYVDDGKPFSFNEDLAVTFQMQIRNRLNYGSILGLHTNGGQNLYFALTGKDDGQLVPTLIYNGKIIEISARVKCDEWFPVALRLNKKQKTIHVSFGQKDTLITSPLPDVETLSVRLGKLPGYETDVVAMNVRDLEIVQDRKLIRHWMLKNHNGDVCLDEIAHAPARAEYPRWLMNQYIEWQEVYSGNTNRRFDIAFNERDALFYLVYPEKIETLNALTGEVTTTEVEGGYPAIEYHAHLLYDTLSNRLISYFQTAQRVSYFSFDTRRWSLDTHSNERADDYNHARAFNPADSSYYFFGGYGFHHYRNRLYRLKVGSNRIEEVTYEPLITPRFSASATVVDGNLYVFGGRGNEQGRQELGTVFYGDLSAIDLKSGKSRLIWDRGTDEKHGLTSMASTMYYDAGERAFYTFSMKNGGSLWKIPMADEEWQPVGKPIQNKLIHQDYNLDFYRSPAHDKLYMAIDKIMSDGEHRFFIYSIDTPLMQEEDIMQHMSEADNSRLIVWYVAGVIFLLLCLCGVCYYYFRRRRPGKLKEELSEKPWTSRKRLIPEDVSAALKGGVPDASDDSENREEEATEEERKPHFNRSIASISLLGRFNVRDKEGKDITVSFTPLLKNFLSLLILYSQNGSKGIPVRQLNEILWMDKDDLSVRNNRNVALRKLRVLLGEVGTAEISKEASSLKITLGEDVFCDYQTVCNYIQELKANKESNTPEMYDRMLELFLYGPLLQDLRVNWLDDFKANYSNNSIDWLDNLLDLELEKRDIQMLLRITDTIFLHDPLNEKALSVKCFVLYENDRKGLAKKAYDNFAKEYEEMLGEPYKTSFMNIVSQKNKENW